jgi:hypothetical protein
VFQGLGKIDKEVHLQLREDYKPKIQTPRRVPMALREPLKQLLIQLEKQEIIEKVDSHTEFVNNILMVKRDDKLRLCLDPVDLNKELQREEYQMPTIDEILCEVKDGKVFTTLDAKKGFWQMCLDEPSSKLTTFWTPFARYKWKRMPFGISPAPELFQKVLHGIIHGLKNTLAIADDILIVGSGKTLQEAIVNHDENLRALLQRCREKNLKLNREKVHLCQSSVKFYGHILSSNGVSADPAKVEAIDRIPIPKDKKHMLTFLGMVTYLSRFLPKLSSITEPLRRLTCADENYQLTKKHIEVFCNIVSIVTL